MTPRVVVLGQLSIDDVVLSDGRTAMGSCGGDAVYAAVGARLWVDDVGIVAPVGIDFPREHIATLAERGFDVDGLREVKAQGIRYWVLYESDGRRTFVQRSPAWASAETAPTSAQIPAAYWDASIFHVAAMPFDAAERLVRAITERRPGAMISLDTHEDQIAGFQDRIAALLPRVTAFLPSREEVTTWFGADEPEHSIGKLRRLGQRWTILKMGAQGSLVTDGSDGPVQRVGTAPGPVVDATGAGDAFCGGFAAALALGHGGIEAASRGAVSAALAIAGFGSLGEPRGASEAQTLLERVTVGGSAR